MRLHQELVLGVGGVRAIRALGHRAGGLAPQRGPLRVPARRAGPRAGRRRRAARRRPSSRSARNERLHDPHAGLGRQRALRRRPRAARRGAAARRRRPPSTGVVDLERLLDLGRGVDDDPRQFDMTAFSLRLLVGANAVSQLHAVTANATWPAIARRPQILGHHQRRPHADLGRAGRCATCTRAILGADLDDLDRAADRGPVLGAHRPRSPTDDLWEAHQRQKLELAVFARGRLRSQFARHGEAPVDARAARGGPRSRRSSRSASRAASRPTSGPACCSPTSSAWPASCGTRSGRSRSSSPARPTRPTGPARA